jgi:hypothetical protein
MAWGAMIEATIDFAAAANATSLHERNGGRTERRIQAGGAVFLKHFVDAERRTRIQFAMCAFFD